MRMITEREIKLCLALKMSIMKMIDNSIRNEILFFIYMWSIIIINYNNNLYITILSISLILIISIFTTGYLPVSGIVIIWMIHHILLLLYDLAWTVYKLPSIIQIAIFIAIGVFIIAFIIIIIIEVFFIQKVILYLSTVLLLIDFMREWLMWVLLSVGIMKPHRWHE